MNESLHSCVGQQAFSRSARSSRYRTSARRRLCGEQQIVCARYVGVFRTRNARIGEQYGIGADVCVALLAVILGKTGALSRDLAVVYIITRSIYAFHIS